MTSRALVLASDDYEPYEHRSRPGQTGKYVALVHLIKCILGTGILALPEAFRNAGLIFGAIVTVIITIFITFCLHLLFNNMYFFCKRDKISQITYPNTFKEALLIGPQFLRRFAGAAPMAVNTFIMANQVGVMCVYMIFISSNVKQVVDIHTSENQHIKREIFMIILFVICLLLSYIKNLKWLAPISNIGNWVTLAGLCCIYKYICTDLEPMSNRDMVAEPKYMPLFLGTVMFAVLSIGAILTIELNLKDGKNWGGKFGVLNQGMVFVTFLNVMTGFFGYWKYGDDTESSITLNIDIHDTLAQIIRLLFSIAITTSYPLHTYPITEILWEQYTYKYMTTSKHLLLWDYVLRTILVISSFLLALWIPRLGLFISLIGTFCLTILGIIFPPLIDTCTRWPNELGTLKIYLIRNIALMIFGLFGWIFGTYTAIVEIVKTFQNE